MAILKIEADPGDNLQGYRFQVDNDPNDLDMGNEDSCTIDNFPGECGDATKHNLYYTLVGPVGAKVGLKIWCDDTLKIDFALEIYVAGPAFNGDVEFEL